MVGKASRMDKIPTCVGGICYPWSAPCQLPGRDGIARKDSKVWCNERKFAIELSVGELVSGGGVLLKSTTKEVCRD